MAIARNPTDLRRSAHLTVIRRAIEFRMPDVALRDVGLKDIAALCRRNFAAYPGRDWNDVRDQLLLIACEWNLARDRLDQQSDACVKCVADFLR